jgi:hypothetical protein
MTLLPENLIHLYPLWKLVGRSNAKKIRALARK